MRISGIHSIAKTFVFLLIFALVLGCSKKDSDDDGAPAAEEALTAKIVSPAGNVTITAGESLNFQAEVSGGKQPYIFSWNFDGASAGTNVQNPGNIIFTTPDTYRVSFSARDDDNTLRSDHIFVTVVSYNDLEPSAAIASPSSDITIAEGKSVNLQGSVSSINPQFTYFWDFEGGAANVIDEDPGDIIFNAEGTYIVTFSVSDADGDADNDTVTVTVTPASIAQWMSISTGVCHTVAIKTDGTLWAWGYNDFGELGIGTQDDSAVPVQVGTETDWASVATGENHTVALKSDNTLWSWGWNLYGQLGTGTFDNSNIPVRVGSDDDWVFAAAGSVHTIALKADGTLWAWGNNSAGQLGTGSSDAYCIPVQVGSDMDWAAVAAGQAHTIALKTDRTLWTWGNNGLGQLGTGSWDASNSPAQVGSDADWVFIAGADNTTFAIKFDGSLWFWGINEAGMLGIGDWNEELVPANIWP
jgi:hypothetical protein